MPSFTGLAAKMTGRAPAVRIRSIIVPMFATNLSVVVPPLSFMPSSTDTTVGFQAAMSYSNRASVLGMVCPPTPELRNANFSFG